MKTEKTTLMDIARRTGLSIGTVDRVLHNRGEVSRKSQEKVMQAIRDLGYEPNMHASLLSSGRQALIAVLIPSPASGPFWSLSEEGIGRAAQATAPLGVTIRKVDYDQTDLDDFRRAARQVLDMAPSGVVVAPMFRHETLGLVEELHRREIPFVFIDSKVENDSYLAYFGMPMYESGYLCGDLLTAGHAVGHLLIVRILSDRHGQSDPTASRREGFMDYLAEHSPGCRVSQVFIDPDDPAQTRQGLDDFFKENPEVRHIVMFNSRIYLIVPWLESNAGTERRVVGFDNLEANVEALTRGTVDILIAQHPDEQVALAVQALSDRAMLDREPARKDNFMHMDILTRYNVKYY